MNINELFAKKTVISYEVFPPKPTTPVQTIYETLQVLKELSPDFISVTYGAGGGKNNNETFHIASTIKNYGLESVVHLPCIGLKKKDVLAKLSELEALGIRNILALRGDMPTTEYSPGDFEHASDLITFIKKQGDFHIIAACYPEGHIEAQSLTTDIEHLKEKVDAGARHLISQLFLSNEYFYSFSERCQTVGIDIPIEAGIMPVINKKQIERISSLCGASIPKKFIAMMNRYENNPIAMRDAGIAYAVDQIVDLMAHHVHGIHLYTMNNPYIAKKIYEAIHNLI